MSRRLNQKLSVVFSAILMVIVYIILHETGHCIVAVACGAQITEFSILTAHVSFINGNFTNFSDLWLHANGALFPYFVSLVYLCLYRERHLPPFLRAFSCFFGIFPSYGLLAWVAIPILFLSGRAPIGDDCTNFLLNFSTSHSPIWVTAAALALIALSGFLVFKKRLPQQFIAELRANQ